MDSMTTSFGEVLLWSFWFFIWIAALMVWFRCAFDLFRDHSLSGWAKAGWVVLLVLVPWLGALIYIIARGRSMNERQMNDFAQARAEQDRYIRQVAGPTPSTSFPADQLASAKSLLDSGPSPRPSSTTSRRRPSPDTLLTRKSNRLVTERHQRDVFYARRDR